MEKKSISQLGNLYGWCDTIEEQEPTWVPTKTIAKV